MPHSIEVILTPAEIAVLPQRDLRETVCVVLDVLRATSTMVTALAHGADSILPAADIPEALALKRRFPDALLAGERDGLRIRAHLTGGVEFDLGNSPAEFTPELVRGRQIIMTTTNGTRALRACAAARETLVGALLNLDALVAFLFRIHPPRLLVVCSGTVEQVSFEDTLVAGALCESVSSLYPPAAYADSVQLALHAFRPFANNLAAGFALGRNGQRLLARPELREDVPFCATPSEFAFVPTLGANGAIRRFP
jgi:2-phosphosulfolactate phosphatase